MWILPCGVRWLSYGGNLDQARGVCPVSDLSSGLAAALRMKESVMETVTTVQENAADILASAKDLNAQRAEQETADTLGQVEEA